MRGHCTALTVYLDKVLLSSFGWKLPSKNSLQDLSTGVTWDYIDELDRLGLLKLGKFALAECENLFACQCGIAPYDNSEW